MTATSRPAPGSPAALLDTVVRSVVEGRYRYARLHLLWNRDRVPPEHMATLITQASAAPQLPVGLTANEVIQRARPQFLPAWLAPHLDAEILRICAGQPVAGTTPLQLVARVVAAVCIDVYVDTLVAADRAARPDGEPPDGAPRTRLIHLGAPDLITLGDDQLSETSPLLPPPPA
jgi:hypothetical protein